MNEIKKPSIKLYMISFAAIFILIWLIESLHTKQRIDEVLHEKLNTVEHHMEIMNGYNKLIAFSSSQEISKDPKIIAIFKKIRNNDKNSAALRKELYQYLLEEYLLLQKTGVSQLHFVLPDNTSFLRMHLPSQYGDDLTQIRYSYRYVNQTHKPVDGLELGRTAHAYRYVYPIFDNSGVYLGAFEISFYIEYVATLIDQVSKSHSHVIIKKMNVNKKVWSNPSLLALKYGHSHEDNRYLQSNLLNNKPHTHDASDPYYHFHRFADQYASKINQKMRQGKSFYLYGNYDDKMISVTFVPYTNIENKEVVGWLVNYNDDNTIIEKILDNQKIFHGMSFVFLLLLHYFIYRNASAKYTLDKNHAEIREEKLLLQTVINTVPIRIFWKDMTGRYIGANKLFLQDANLNSESDIIGKNDFDMVWSKEAELYIADDKQVVQSGQPKLNIIEEQTQSDGKKVIIETSKVPLKNSRGETIGLLGVYQDITEDVLRKELIDALTQSNAQLDNAMQEVEKANQTKSQFLANMSHEIRTPMNAVIGMTDLALETNLQGAERNYVEKANKAAKNLLVIINDILDFSKMEAGKLEFSNTHFELKTIISNTLHLISNSAKEKNLRTRIKIDKEVPDIYFADDLRLAQVLTNLANNAVKFSHEGGNITFSISVLDQNDSYAQLQFSVQDEGIGISQENQAKLFQSFSQAESTTTRNFGGTGLGLAIAKKIVEQMGGDIWVKSEENKGSSFFFTVKLQKSDKDALLESAQDTKQAMHLAVEKLHGCRILLVEDNDMNQELAMDLLIKKGMKVTVANNGLEALTILEKENFDGVLMDCQMPVMDGYEATRKIRENEKYKDLPVIAMTANAMEGDRQKAIDSGMNDHIAKPINPADMFVTIAKWIKKAKADREPKEKRETEISFDF